ncbi:MAG: spore coat protein GerQ [Bacilli bacterium]|nr:spore coat protein GerQ [Bacilli bacterium]
MNNNNYYNPVYPNGYVDNGSTTFDNEQSYIENIIRLNKGKIGRFYMTFPDSLEWRDRVFSGIIEQSGKDHIIISDPTTGKWYLLLLIYLDYVEFDEKINYIKSF